MKYLTTLAAALAFAVSAFAFTPVANAGPQDTGAAHSSSGTAQTQIGA